MDYNILVSFRLRILNSRNTDCGGNIARRNQHRTAERLIIQPLAGSTGNQIIHHQILGMIAHAVNQQTRPIVSSSLLLLHGHGIHSGNADDREFIIDNENLHLNGYGSQESVVCRHSEDDVFNPLDILVLVGSNHDHPLTLASFECELAWNLNIVEIVFGVAGNDIRNLQWIGLVAFPRKLQDGDIPTILIGKPINDRD